MQELQSVEDFISAVSSCSVSSLDLGCKRLSVRTPPRRQSATSFAVLKASTTGAIVHSGHVVLRKDAVLLLSGEGIHFSGTSFSGTFPVACTHSIHASILFPKRHDHQCLHFFKFAMNGLHLQCLVSDIWRVHNRSRSDSALSALFCSPVLQPYSAVAFLHNYHCVNVRVCLRDKIH